MANCVDNRCELDSKYETPLLPFLPVEFDNFAPEFNKTVTTPAQTETETTMTTTEPISEISTIAVSVNERDQADKFSRDGDFDLIEQNDVVIAAPVVKKVDLAINFNCSQSERQVAEIISKTS